ncbi:MAG: hypothetical protein ABFS42_09985, partial [Candidatus Krumholzibacteriota bacterium]
QPYWVSEGNILGRSNRFNAMLVGAEFGRILPVGVRSAVDLFVGAGGDVVTPFKDEEIYLGTFNLNAGLGYRLFLGRERNVSLGLDARREWIGERNEGRYSMSGGAWSLRFTLGIAYNNGDARRLESLGQ